MTVKIKFNKVGLEEVLRSGAMAAAVKAAADGVASRVEPVDVDGIPGKYAIPVKVTEDVTSNMHMNRARATVWLAHPAGMNVQAKHGSLTKAV